MAETQDISTALKRTLKAGKEYSKLIPRVSCKQTPLGAGDTYYTVDQMRGWIEKFRHQTAKLALTIEGHTLQETVNNIYQFLYDHVQYTADGALQQLRSPACTWAQRKQGVDCKSFSVFASSLLSNLGIVHAIRQVRQPYFYPEEFTHVYVVVPVDQSKDTISLNAPTFVLDATRHENTEVEFIEKADLHMNKLTHVGLNAPQDERTAKIIKNFNSFCNHLLENGVPVPLVNELRKEVSTHTSRGIDPKFSFTENGLVIQDKFFPIKFNPITGAYVGSGLGIAVTSAVAAGTAITKMLPVGFFNDTFGALFANGFRPDCWNTSNSPSKSKEEVAIDGPDFYKRAKLEQSVSAANINSFVEMAEVYIAARAFGETNNDLSGCTKDGNKMGKQLMQGFLDKTLTEIRSQLSAKGYKLVTASQSNPTQGNVKINSSYHHGAIPKTRYDLKITKYNVEEAENTGSGSNGNNTGGGSNYQPGGSTDSNGNATAKKSGSNTGIIIGGVALAALPFLLPMMKKSPVATTKKPKAKAKTKTKKTAK